MNWLEIIASVLGVICVWLVVRRNIWTFPIGLVQVALTAIVCYQSRLYSDMLLQGVFGIMQVQGWVLWSRSDRADDQRIAVRSLSNRQWLVTGILLLAGTFGLG
ncbi:MAG TPA: nicotinamide riboside transporter PnuC, partial [Saprospiraceae bacterium]|nr:nicotinamide riboside transporter PnuC [Saprospiraceae bacterium]